MLVNAMHITASVFINDNKSALHHDYDVWLRNLFLTNRFHSTGTMSVKTTGTPIIRDNVDYPLSVSRTYFLEVNSCLPNQVHQYCCKMD